MILTLQDGRLSMKEIRQFKFGQLQQIAQIEHVNLKGHVEELSGDLYVHLTRFEKREWSITLYKEMLKTWSDIQKYLHSTLKINSMKTVIDDEDHETEKFLNMFGFVAEDTCTVLENGDRAVVMKVEF